MTEPDVHERDRTHTMNGGGLYRSVAELFGDLSDQVVTLMKQELALARVELLQQGKVMARDAIMVGVGAALGFAALLTGVAAVVLVVVALGVAPWLATFAVTVLAAIVAYVLMNAGLASMRRHMVVPRQTVQSIKETAQWLKKETVGSIGR